jgi:hypothetical protein
MPPNLCAALERRRAEPREVGLLLLRPHPVERLLELGLEPLELPRGRALACLLEYRRAQLHDLAAVGELLAPVGLARARRFPPERIELRQDERGEGKRTEGRRGAPRLRPRAPGHDLAGIYRGGSRLGRLHDERRVRPRRVLDHRRRQEEVVGLHARVDEPCGAVGLRATVEDDRAQEGARGDHRDRERVEPVGQEAPQPRGEEEKRVQTRKNEEEQVRLRAELGRELPTRHPAQQLPRLARAARPRAAGRAPVPQHRARRIAHVPPPDPQAPRT